MSTGETIRTLLLIGLILEVIFIIQAFFGVLFLPSMLAIAILWLPTPPQSEVLAFVALFTQFLIGWYLLNGILGIMYVILWFRWRRHPDAHRRGFIITGALGLLFGFIPGLIVLIAGRMIPREDKKE